MNITNRLLSASRHYLEIVPYAESPDETCLTFYFQGNVYSEIKSEFEALSKQENEVVERQRDEAVAEAERLRGVLQEAQGAITELRVKLTPDVSSTLDFPYYGGVQQRIAEALAAKEPETGEQPK